MKSSGQAIRSGVTHTRSFLVGLLLGGLGVAVVMLLAPPRTRYVWRITRTAVTPPPV